MLRNVLQLAVLFSASLIALPGQDPTALAAIERSGLISGMPVPSVAGAPFSATAVVELQLDTGDDDPVTLRTISLVARDSKGRTRRETRRLMPVSFHGSPPLLAVLIYDPQTHIYTIYDPILHVARRQVVPEPVKADDKSDPKVHKEDLGPSSMDGLATHGTREIRKISSKLGFLGASVETELEEWHSDDLHLDLLVRYADPRIGTETIGISNLKREDPPASTFEIPKDTKITNVAPNSTFQQPGRDGASITFTP